jgi:hypothetical protein
MQAEQNNFAYHGGEVAVRTIWPNHRGENDEVLCTSCSVNVAARYGKIVSRFIINSVPTTRMTVKEWMLGKPTLDDLRKKGFQAVIVTGDPSTYDFPVDMLVALDAAALTFDRTLTDSEIQTLDDQLPVRHDPTGPADRGWEIWLENHCSDVDTALKDLGWLVIPNEYYSFSIPADEAWREYEVEVTPGWPQRYRKPANAPKECWTIANNRGCDDGVAHSKADALRTADRWLREEVERRRLEKETPVSAAVPEAESEEVLF